MGRPALLTQPHQEVCISLCIIYLFIFFKYVCFVSHHFFNCLINRARMMEGGGVTRSKGPQAGTRKPGAAAARAKPLYMGRLLYPLS